MPSIDIKFELEPFIVPNSILAKTTGSKYGMEKRISVSDIPQDVLEQLCDDFKEGLVARGKVVPEEKDDSPLGKLFEAAHQDHIKHMKPLASIFDHPQRENVLSASVEKKSCVGSAFCGGCGEPWDENRLTCPKCECAVRRWKAAETGTDSVQSVPKDQVITYDPCPKCGCRHIPGSSFCDGDEKALYEKNKALQSTENKTEEDKYLFIGGSADGKIFLMPKNMNRTVLENDIYWKSQLRPGSKYVFIKESISVNDGIELLIGSYHSKQTPQPSSPTPAS